MRYCKNGVYGEIDTLPGCTQVAVSHSVFAPVNQRGKGKGREAMHLRLGMIYHDLGYDYVLCTVDSANERQKHILIQHGWRKLDFFKSTKTGHTVELWGLDGLCYGPRTVNPPTAEEASYDAWEKSLEGCCRD